MWSLLKDLFAKKVNSKKGIKSFQVGLDEIVYDAHNSVHIYKIETKKLQAVSLRRVLETLIEGSKDAFFSDEEIIDVIEKNVLHPTGVGIKPPAFIFFIIKEDENFGIREYFVDTSTSSSYFGDELESKKIIPGCSDMQYYAAKKM